MNESSEHNLLVSVRHVLTTRFNESELRTLSFDFGIDYDGLPGQGTADKAREIVTYCQRHNCLPDLIKIGRQQRQDILWDDLLSGTPQDSLSHLHQDTGNSEITQVAMGKGIAQAAGPHATAHVTIRNNTEEFKD